MKKKNIIIIIVVALAVLVFTLKDNFGEIVKVFFNVNMFYLFIAFILLLITDLLRSLGFFFLLKKIIPSYKYINAYKMVIISNLFNAVTPFASGGQVYQVVSLTKKNNTKYSTAISVIFSNLFMYHVAFTILSTIFIVLNIFYKFVELDLFLNKLILIGYIINTSIAVIYSLILFEKKGSDYIARKILKFLNKINIIKNNNFNKLDSSLDGFYSSLKEFKSQKRIFINGILANVCMLMIMCIIPIVIFKAVGVTGNINAMSAIISYIFILLVCGLVPIPGGTGGFEFGFLTFFGYLASGPVLKVGMLVWRLLTYYFLVLFGSTLFIIDKKE